MAQVPLARTRLWEASDAGDVEAILAALEAGAEVEARQLRNLRPHARSRAGYFHDEDRVVHQTLSNEPQETIELVGGVFRLQGPDGAAEPSRSLGKTALMLAATGGRSQAVALLLRMRATPHLKDEEGMQPLHFAASAGCRECCKALLHAKALPTVLDGRGRDAFACLPLASTADDLDRVQWAALLAPRGGVRFVEDDFVGSIGPHQEPEVASSVQPPFPRLPSLEGWPRGARGCSAPLSVASRLTGAGAPDSCGSSVLPLPIDPDAADAAGVDTFWAAADDQANFGLPAEPSTARAPDPLAVPRTGLRQSGVPPT